MTEAETPKPHGDRGDRGGRGDHGGGNPLSARAAARLAAVQALYQMTVTGQGAAAVVEDFLSHRFLPPGPNAEAEAEQPALAQADLAFFETLVRGAAAETSDLDDMLAAVLAEGWPVERLETLLRLILRAGAYELGHLPDVPARVVVSQYVDLAHAFLDDKQTAMANGVLDRLARGLRPDEFDEGSGGGSGDDVLADLAGKA